MVLNCSSWPSFTNSVETENIAVHSLLMMFQLIFLQLSANVLALLAPWTLAAQSPACKAVPGSSAWPSAADWAALDFAVGGRLLKPPPPAAVCHPDQPTYNEIACKSTNWTDTATYANNPIGIINPNWSNDSCLPQPKYPCSGEGFPVYVVKAIRAEDVAAGVVFARQHNIRLNVKGSGHDYLGRYCSYSSRE